MKFNKKVLMLATILLTLGLFTSIASADDISDKQFSVPKSDYKRLIKLGFSEEEILALPKESYIKLKDTAADEVSTQKNYYRIQKEASNLNNEIVTEVSEFEYLNGVREVNASNLMNLDNQNSIAALGYDDSRYVDVGWVQIKGTMSKQPSGDIYIKNTATSSALNFILQQRSIGIGTNSNMSIIPGREIFQHKFYTDIYDKTMYQNSWSATSKNSNGYAFNYSHPGNTRNHSTYMIVYARPNTSGLIRADAYCHFAKSSLSGSVSISGSGISLSPSYAWKSVSPLHLQISY